MIKCVLNCSFNICEKGILSNILSKNWKIFLLFQLIRTMNHAFKWEQQVYPMLEYQNLALVNFVYLETWGTWSIRNGLQRLKIWAQFIMPDEKKLQYKEYLKRPVKKNKHTTMFSYSVITNIIFIQEFFQHHRFVEAQFNDFNNVI